VDGILAADQVCEQLDIPLVYLTAYEDHGTLKRANPDPGIWLRHEAHRFGQLEGIYCSRRPLLDEHDRSRSHLVT
jgi:hypothetical protein